MQKSLTHAVCCEEMQTPLRSVAATRPVGARPAVLREALHGRVGALERLRKLLRRQAEVAAHLAHTGCGRRQSCGGSLQR